MPELKTVNDIFRRAFESDNSRCMLWRDPQGTWQPLASQDLYRRVRAVAAGLEKWGIKKGDRVGIIAENRWEWAVVDFATLAFGAVDVPIYPTLNAEQSAYMLRDSGTRILFVSTRKQFEKIAPLRHETAIERIVIMDDEAIEGATRFADLLKTEAPGSGDAEFNARLADVGPDDLATIIYTSGTTGNSKGVELTHGNIASNIPPSTAPFDWSKGKLCISFLPLSHITARALDYAIFTFQATIAYCPSFELLAQTIQEVKPTIFVSVPRVYEKIRQAVEQRATQSPVKQRLFHWAMRTGRKHRDEILNGRTPSSLSWQLAHKLVLSKIRGAFGGRLEEAISGGAPLGMDTAGWFADAGLRIFEGYGLTETSPVIALNHPTAHRIGSVGKTLPNLQCRIADDGELLVKGPSVFHRYWNNPEATREAFTEDGFFCTGDIGRIDEDGFLFITDRKKELLKTSGGKFVAPQPIEGKLKANLLVGHAALVGDKHKFVSVLLSPNFAALEAWATQHGIPSEDRETLVADSRVIAEYQRIVDQVNATLSNFETMKRMHLVAEEWSLDSGELTPSLKLKRRVINERYAPAIRSFYESEAVAQRQPV
jgi:long-chain acyl-CoA synthetase